MQGFCPNCGDPIEQDEVFCDKCGTKLISNEKLPGEQSHYGHNQEPLKNNYQNQYSYDQPQQNMQHFQNNQYQESYGRKKKKNVGQIIWIAGAVIFVICVIIVGLANLSSLFDKPSSGTKDDPKPVTTNNNSQSSKVLAAWTANLNSLANYDATKKSIYVDYSVALKNKGTGKADSIKVYLDPEEKDENAKYLGIQPKTIVDTSGAQISIGAGETKELKTRFYYNNIEQAGATQQILQDVANRYIKIPLLVEWQENGKVYTQKLVVN